MSVDPGSVSAVLVTMGDVDLTPIIEPMPYGEVVIWDNDMTKTAQQIHDEMHRYARTLGIVAEPYWAPPSPAWRPVKIPRRSRPELRYATLRADFKVFGRYIALRHATKPVIFFQDDDCVLTPEQHQAMLDAYEPGVVTGNMIYHDPVWVERYADTTLLGWGAIFDRHLPFAAFREYARFHPLDWDFMTSPGGAEVVFPMLSVTKTVQAGAAWLDEPRDGIKEVFGRPNRMSNQPAFLETRLAWLEKARHVRDLIIEGA